MKDTGCRKDTCLGNGLDVGFLGMSKERGRVPVSCLTRCRWCGPGHRHDRWTATQRRVEGDNHGQSR